MRNNKVAIVLGVLILFHDTNLDHSRAFSHIANRLGVVSAL